MNFGGATVSVIFVPVVLAVLLGGWSWWPSGPGTVCGRGTGSIAWHLQTDIIDWGTLETQALKEKQYREHCTKVLARLD